MRYRCRICNKDFDKLEDALECQEADIVRWRRKLAAEAAGKENKQGQQENKMNDTNIVVVSGTIVESRRHSGVPVRLSSTQSGKTCADFSLRSVQHWSGGESQTYINCKLWGDAAQAVKDLSFGTKVVVTGRISTETWQDRNGQNRVDTIIRADNVTACGQGEAVQQQASQPYQRQYAPRNNAGYARPQGGYAAQGGYAQPQAQPPSQSQGQPPYMQQPQAAPPQAASADIDDQADEGGMPF